MKSVTNNLQVRTEIKEGHCMAMKGFQNGIFCESQFEILEDDPD